MDSVPHNFYLYSHVTYNESTIKGIVYLLLKNCTVSNQA
jgi:hypothetical protein